jgi:hypothetical protein
MEEIMCKTLKYKYEAIFLVLFFSSACFAQFPYTFIEQAHNTQYGLPAKAVMGKDGVVFVSAVSSDRIGMRSLRILL